MDKMNIRKAAMIGCGFVGASSAFALMQSGIFSEMVMIDADHAKAEGEAMDLSHGLPFARPVTIYAGDYDEIYDAAIEALQDILQPDGLLLMMNQNTHHVFSVIRKCGSIACTKSYSVPTDSMLQELKDSPNLIMLNDTGKHILDLLTPRQRNWLNAEHITAIYTLKYNQVIIGFLYIAAHDGQDFAPEELRYLEKICYYSSYALRNANLYQNAYRASITDDLTSLYNRKHAFECIDHVCQHQKPSTLIVLDIDDFKLYNELYGAQESDNLIHRFAQVILQEISSKDIGFRFGADEFLILKAGTDIDEACSFSGRRPRFFACLPSRRKISC